MPIMIYPEKMDPAAVSAHAAEIANVKNPMLASLCLITGSTLGGSKEYLTSIINAKDVDKLEYGESLCVFSPTGSGKTKAMELIIAALSSDSHLIVLANRRICKTQVLKDLIKCPNIPGALIEKIKVNDNVEVMTYQEFARKKHKYQGKKLVLTIRNESILQQRQVMFFLFYGTLRICPISLSVSLTLTIYSIFYE